MDSTYLYFNNVIMLLRNHIAKRFLTDPIFTMEIVETMHPNQTEVDESMATTFQLVDAKDQKAYYVTDSVLEKLELLKITKKSEHYDWTVFHEVKDCKKTFIFPNNQCLRMWISGDTIMFCHLMFKFHKGSKNEGVSNWVMFYLNRITGELCDHFKHQDVTSIEEFIYKLLCFVFLSDNEEILVEPGRKYGTKKQGKVINELTIPLTVINSRWNVTTIRTDSFGVRGHFALRRVGEGRVNTRMVFIQPFEKKGYVRRAANLI